MRPEIVCFKKDHFFFKDFSSLNIQQNYFRIQTVSEVIIDFHSDSSNIRKSRIYMKILSEMLSHVFQTVKVPAVL